MRLTLTLGLVAALVLLSGCVSSRRSGDRCRVAQAPAQAPAERPVLTASGSASGTYYAPPPPREVMTRLVSRPAPTQRAFTYAAPPPPSFPVAAKPCRPARIASIFCPPAPCPPEPCAPKADDRCPGGVCGIPAVEDCRPGGLPSLEELFNINPGCK